MEESFASAVEHFDVDPTKNHVSQISFARRILKVISLKDISPILSTNSCKFISVFSNTYAWKLVYLRKGLKPPFHKDSFSGIKISLLGLKSNTAASNSLRVWFVLNLLKYLSFCESGVFCSDS